MKCQTEFDLDSWTCPACHWLPSKIHGFYSFSPELACENDGLNIDSHHVLDKLQDESFWFRERNCLIQDALKKYFPNASTVLEIGCGSGYVLNAIRQALPSAYLTATEIYSYSLRYAENKVSQPCRFLQVDARQLPFKHEFDLIGAFDVLEHIDDHELVLRNIRDSLKSGGGVIFTVPQHPWLWSKVDEAACHKRRYTRRELSTLLQQYNFDLVQDTSFMFFLLPLMLLQRLISSKAGNYNPSDELVLPKIIDKTFEIILRFERQLIRLGLKFPIGGSRLVVARLK